MYENVLHPPCGLPYNAPWREFAMPELLAPAGDLRCLKTAYMFGADAAYIGGPALQLRAPKTGFTHEKVAEAASLAHS